MARPDKAATVADLKGQFSGSAAVVLTEYRGLRVKDLKELRRGILEILGAEPLAKIEYLELVDPDTFSPPGTLAVMAVWIGNTRLIDNADLAQPFPG